MLALAGLGPDRRSDASFVEQYAVLAAERVDGGDVERQCRMLATQEGERAGAHIEELHRGSVGGIEQRRDLGLER